VADGGSNSSNRKVSHGLVALSSAAVLAVYGAGYQRTKAAAERFEHQAAERRSPGGGKAAVAPGPRAIVAAPAVDAGEPLPPVRSGAPAAPSTNRPSASQEPAAAVAPPTATIEAAAPVTTPVIADHEPTAQTETAAAAPVTAVAGPSETAPAAPQAPKSVYADGTYLGWGSCRHGDIQAQVVVAGGRITSATIAQCLTRYACTWIDPLLPQVAQRQSAEVDYVSGATESSYAFYDAVVEALSKAR
jgi:uncharacterized protein with FMN-binding domain